MNLKEVKHRIQTVKTTQKITSAMKLVSAAKLRRAQSAIEGMRPYEAKLDAILAASLAGAKEIATPYTSVRETKRVALIVVSSSSSLCGAFNSNIIREAKEVINSYLLSGVELELYPVGKKISDAIGKMGLAQNKILLEQAGNVSYSVAAAVASDLMKRFAGGELDKIEILYTRFYSATKQLPVKTLLLPANMGHSTREGSPHAIEYIFEPGKEELLKQLLPRVIKLRLFTSLLDSATAEHAARMLAMQIATDNAEDLINELVLEYNKGRQQAITNEILDMVSGSTNQ